MEKFHNLNISILFDDRKFSLPLNKLRYLQYNFSYNFSSDIKELEILQMKQVSVYCRTKLRYPFYKMTLANI